MMLISPRFNIANIFTGKDESFVLCKEGQCTEAIGYQVAFFLLLKPFANLMKYFWYTVGRFFYQKYCLNVPTDRDVETSRVDSILIRHIEKQYRLYSGQR